MLRQATSTLLLALAAAGLAAQSPMDSLESHPASKPKPQYVTYLFPEQVTLPAGKPSPVDLHFKVADGLHINTHTPKEESLIPTTLNLPETSGVHLEKAVYPAGSPYSFPDQPQEKLIVYTGEFTIHTQLTASKGNHLVQATLRYQACSNNTCLPPRSVPVAIDVIAK
jgi:DsbC/DsbD-like thiol-disulfide interchange protein